MRLSRFTDYSLRVLIYLGQNSDSRVTINQISESYDISKNHLMKVVSNLTRMKLVVAQRGPGGGIKLNRPPEDIDLSEIISTTEKHLPEPGEMPSFGPSDQSADERLRDYLQQALHVYVQTLGQFTLADVLGTNSEDVLSETA